jgi:hypothetical protein
VRYRRIAPRTVGVTIIPIAALALVATGTLMTPSGAGASIARPARLTAVEFHAHSPLGKGITCAMYERSGEPGTVLCESYGPGRESTATLDAKGRVALCATYNWRRNACPLGNAGVGTPTFGYGRQVTVGRFRCVVMRKGVECRVVATGAGFLFNPVKAVRVAGALPAPLHLPNFLSPDRRVWCGIGEGRDGFCGTGYFDTSKNEPQSSAMFGSDGKVTICSVAVPTFSEGCIQNWDANAPVLQYGQQSELEGVLCTSATNGITCMKVAGA